MLNDPPVFHTVLNDPPGLHTVLNDLSSLNKKVKDASDLSSMLKMPLLVSAESNINPILLKSNIK